MSSTTEEDRTVSTPSPAPLDQVRDRRTRRREALLDAADRAIRRDGPDTSMAAIAAEAGITKPILYRVFGDKGGLYRALALRHTETLLAVLHDALATRGSLRDRTRATIDAYLSLLEEHPETYRFLMAGDAAAEPTVQGFVESFQRRVADLLAAGLRHELGLAPEDPDPRPAVWAHGLAGMSRGAGDWWIAHRGTVERATVADQLTAMLFGDFAAVGR
jgi:AcrR family transcriptional regulator